jgi:hypothetical protein
LREVEAPTFSDIRLIDGGKVKIVFWRCVVRVLSGIANILKSCWVREYGNYECVGLEVLGLVVIKSYIFWYSVHYLIPE